MRTSRRGMTLVEIMVAITILVVMAAVIAETLQNSIEFNRLLSQRDEVTRGARVALSTLRRTINLAYLTPSRTAIDRYETVFVGVDDDPDQLFFATLAHQRLYMDARESDEGEVSVFVDDGPPEGGPGQVLYLREAGLVDDEPGEGGKVMPLAYNVRSFELRYLDSQTSEWKDEWDTRNAETPYRLPRAVEIALVLITEDPDDPESTIDVPFLSTVQLHYASPMVNPQVAAAQQLIAAANGTTVLGNGTQYNPANPCAGNNGPCGYAITASGSSSGAGSSSAPNRNGLPSAPRAGGPPVGGKGLPTPPGLKRR